MNVIFLLPIAMAATGDGCSTTPENVAVADKEIRSLLSNNTVQIKDEDVYAFTRADGTMSGLNIASGGKTGKWWVNDKGQLCADWTDDDQDVRCDKLLFSKDKEYQWMETSLVLIKGNAKGL